MHGLFFPLTSPIGPLIDWFMAATNYDSWKLEPLTVEEWVEQPPCPVCTGEEGDPCSEECARIARRAEVFRATRRLYQWARLCIAYIRIYRDEPGGAGARERPLLDTVANCRRTIRSMRESAS